MEGTRTRMIEYFDNLPRIESNDLSTFTSALPRFPNLAILLYLICCRGRLEIRRAAYATLVKACSIVHFCSDPLFSSRRARAIPISWFWIWTPAMDKRPAGLDLLFARFSKMIQFSLHSATLVFRDDLCSFLSVRCNELSYSQSQGKESKQSNNRGDKDLQHQVALF
jgi:hypothetical protein